MNSRALVTFGVGPHAELLDLALPSFQAFADRHGYDLLVANPEPCVRPPSWMKIPVLQETLDAYQEALWVDADIVIVDASHDVPCSDNAWQAIVRHHTSDGEVPNLGVWYLRQRMRPVLAGLWERVEYTEHPWWEQAAMLDLLGYRHQARPCVLEWPTPLYQRTMFLDPGWNVHRNDQQPVDRPRFMHATCWPDRATVMGEWAQPKAVAA